MKTILHMSMAALMVLSLSTAAFAAPPRADSRTYVAPMSGPTIGSLEWWAQFAS